MNKMHRFLELFWLGVAILASLATLIYSVQDGFYQNRLFWLMTGIAWAMYFVRKGVRKRMQKFEESKPKGKGKK